MPVKSDAIGARICEALGLPVDKIDALSIHLRTGEDVEVYVECRPSADALFKLGDALEEVGVKVDLTEVADVVKRYRLTRVDD